MGRRIFKATTNSYHLSARCINKEWFTIPMPIVWNIMTDHLYFLAHGFNQQIHAFVLMSNHFHLILSAPDLNISSAMHYFMRETSRSIGLEAGRCNSVWGKRFDRCEIGSHHYYLNAYKYVYRNPVKAKICQRVEAYPYSTLYGLTGQGPMHIPMVEDTSFFATPSDCLAWLNAATNLENEDAVRKALRRSMFALPKLDSRNHPLEIDLL